MSSLIVEVVTVAEVSPHSNADKLFLAKIKGWQTVIKKQEDGSPQFKEGEKVVYIPPDSTIPKEMAEKMGILNYLGEKTNIDGKKELVVKRVRLRGEPSFGLVIHPADATWKIGEDVKEYYQITKFMPPVKFGAGDSETENPLFQRYTNIENLRHFPEVIQEGEEVTLTEKIHGTNSRIGYIEEVLVAGSHRLQRMQPSEDKLENNVYWFPSTLKPVMNLLNELKKKAKQIILFGEIYGSKIQKLHYGKQNKLGYAAFDLFLDGNYLNDGEFRLLCEKFQVDCAPVLAKGPYSLEFVKRFSEGNTTFKEKHIREGVIVKVAQERFDPKIGRVILKYISDEYLLNGKLASADATDF